MAKIKTYIKLIIKMHQIKVIVLARQLLLFANIVKTKKIFLIYIIINTDS